MVTKWVTIQHNKKRGLHRLPGKTPFLFHFSMGIEESVLRIEMCV